MDDNLEKNSIFGVKPDSARVVPIVVGCIVLLFAVIAVVVIKIVIESNQPRIDLLYTPESALVTLDGEIVESGEKVVSAGKHEIKAEKYGFEPESFTVEVGWGEATPVQIIMTPNKDETSDWYFENEKDGRIIEGISGHQYEAESDDMLLMYPILEKLPIYKDDFNIYQQGCDEPTLCILIDTNEDYYDDAIEYFRAELDDDLGEYRFIFYDYSNPFLGEG